MNMTPDFFVVEKYNYQNEHTCDFSSCPRPHFCMGYILKGSAEFKDAEGKSVVSLSEGDIIFVPVTSQYISVWKGNPEISYISFHFYFSDGAIDEKDNFTLQKITPDDIEQTKKAFEKAHKYNGSSFSSRCIALGCFYEVLGEVLPKLKQHQRIEHDERIEKAINHISLHPEEKLTIPELAAMCNLSTSHFYNKFKSETGQSPIDYKNRILVSKALVLLTSNKDMSIEDISFALGFSSSSYFRRVFKECTGKSPAKFKKASIEL